ncbi:MAG: nicotinate (nicotinamide) nucleotide adenylyltransferase [Flavobacteriales bacterium]
MKIGLFFGSFNPIHVGHLALAQAVLNDGFVEQVWFVVTPQNPLKEKKTLLQGSLRLNLVREAAQNHLRFRVCDIEFHLKPPFYTAVTLTHLKEKHPNHSFSLLIGEDNLMGLTRWYNASYIINNHPIIVYPRQNKSDGVPQEAQLPIEGEIRVLADSPSINISSSQIRDLIKNRKSIRYLVPDEVLEIIENSGYYR